MNEQKKAELDPSRIALSAGTRASYGLGDVSCNVVFGMITTLLTLFYTDYVGVPIATVGVVMLLSRIFDGVSDVIMGVIVSKTKSKWGMARPWILWASLPYCICAVLLFTVPHSTAMVQFIYMIVTYNLCTTVCYTAINVPYGTLSTRMTRISHERDMLAVFRMGMSPMGKILSVTLTMPLVKLFGNDQSAWIKTMSIWAVFALIMLIICFVRCKETVPLKIIPKENKPKAKKTLKSLLTNQYFWSTTILWTLTCLHTTIVGTTLPYYCKYIFGNDGYVYSMLYFLETIMLVVSAMICPLFLKKFGKRNVSLAGAILAVIAQASFFFGTKSLILAAVTILIRSIGVGQLNAVIFGMMGDAVDFGEWKSGLRQEALVFGGGSLGFKFGTGIASAVLTVMMSAAGYISSTTGSVKQPESAILMIKNIYVWGPILVWVVAVIVLILYKLDKKYKGIMDELGEREVSGEM